MRIIAGTARGRRLMAPSGVQTRPTTDRVRESLFSILGDVDGAIVVDGFAGTGALGCEALSRGAARCYFFDTSRRAVELIRENVRRVGGEDRAIIVQTTFERGVAEHVKDEADVWFLDPPYGTALAGKALAVLGNSARVTEGALVVLENEIDDSVPQSEAFELEDERQYGRTRLLLYRRR